MGKSPAESKKRVGEFGSEGRISCNCVDASERETACGQDSRAFALHGLINPILRYLDTLPIKGVRSSNHEDSNNQSEQPIRVLLVMVLSPKELDNP